MLPETENQPASAGLPSPRLELDELFPSGWVEGGMAILDVEGRLQGANEALRAWLEIPAEALRSGGAIFWDLLASKCPAWKAPLLELARSESPFDEARLSLPASGSAAQLWYRVETARHAAGRFVRVASFLPPRSELADAPWDEHLRTPSARREMFVRLLRAEAQLEKLTQYWPGVIFSQRPDFTFLFVSPKVELLTGVALSEWQSRGERFWQVIHEADAGELRQQLRRAARTRAPVTNTFRLRHAQTGQISYVLEHRQPVLSPGGLLLGYEGVWLDVTRQTIAEKRLSSAAWKETLAVLTMGLAHDFSNIMAGIHSLSECFLAQIDASHAFHEGLGLIQRNSLQASQLVHRIINLHLGKTGDRNYHDLNQIVNELSDLVRKITPRRIKVGIEPATSPLPVYVDAVEFQQVIINLALNAVDAMAGPGQLTLKTSLHPAWDPPANLQGVPPRLPCVCLTVEDSGCGIKPAHQKSIFDPFFTTKSVNKGSGLGLYNARLFVEKHHGAISVESEEGQGARFHLWLPQAEFSETERALGEAGEAVPRRSLLLLGPDGTMLQETAELLRTQGYHVVCATTPESAAEVLRVGDYSFSGLYVLLEVTSLGLASAIKDWRAAHPPLKVILKPVGRDGDELGPEFLDHADLVITPEMSQFSVFEKLKSTLEN